MVNERVQAVSRLLFRKVGHEHKPFKQGMVSRVRKKTMSTQSVDFKAPHSAKTKQAWRYPGNKVVRAPSTRLGSGVYTDPKHPNENLPRRKQESNFFITINSNKSPATTEHTRLVVQQMEKMLKNISNEAVLATYLKFGPKDKIPYAEDKYADVIHSIDWKAAVETGDVMKRVHAHIWLTITHYSQVQINVQMLMHYARQHYNDGMPYGVRIGGDHHGKGGSFLTLDEMPYVHVKLLPQGDWTDVMRQYIHKGMAAA